MSAWKFPTRELSSTGGFVRQANRFTERLRPDGSYQLYASLACPWAQRALIVRHLLGLQERIGVTIVDPIRDERGWRFTLSEDGRDPVTGASYLSELYLGTDASYEGRYTVPCVWDTVEKRLVTNDFPQITLDFSLVLPHSGPDLYPVRLRAEIDSLNEWLYHGLNNGVYKAGFATSQEAYEQAVDAVFATLDELEVRLARAPYLFGDSPTESDVRLYTTLARFDAVYYSHFKCSLRRLIDYPNLWAYARRLYQQPAFRSTTDFDHIKRHYFMTHPHINPTGIVPKSPIADWTAPAES